MKLLATQIALFVYMFLLASLASCGDSDKQTREIPEVNVKSSASTNSDVFNKSFEKLLTSYYSVKDALVDYDTVKANAAAKELAVDVKNLALDEIKNDSTGVIKETAKTYTGSIQDSALVFVGETTIQKKKKAFQKISDDMYDLVRTMRYDRQTIYHQHCPMAFNDDQEAYWLSDSRTIANPYLGKKHPKFKDAMVGCGDITDSIEAKR